MEQLVVDLEVKMEDGQKGVFSGYGSTFGNVDLGKDKCVKGCFSRSLKEMKAAGEMPQMLWMHKPELPIGDWEEIEEDDKGLKVKGRLWIGCGIPEAERAYKMLTGSGSKGLSIGFKTKQATHDKSGVRSLTDVDVPEISVVGRGMNPKAKVETVKGADMLQRFTGFKEGKTELELKQLDALRVEMKTNPYHEPAGSPIGGQFANAPGGRTGKKPSIHSQLQDETEVTHNGRNARVLGKPDSDPSAGVHIVYSDNPDQDAFVNHTELTLGHKPNPVPKFETAEHARRGQQAIDETQKLLDKEMGYSADLRNHDRVKEYQTHIANLKKRLAEHAGGQSLTQTYPKEVRQVTSVADIKEGELLHTPKEGANSLTGTGPMVTKTVKITGIERSIIGKMIVGQVTHFNGIPAEEFIAKDKLYSTLRPDQKAALVQYKLHDSRLSLGGYQVGGKGPKVKTVRNHAPVKTPAQVGEDTTYQERAYHGVLGQRRQNINPFTR